MSTLPAVASEALSTLRLTQTAEGEDRYRVEIALEGPWRRRADVRFSFTLSAQDQENLRWYLEEYLEKPSEPAPTVAAQVEQRMDEIGTELFRALFQANEQGRDIWSRLRDTLNDTRVEIITEVREAAAIPWELLRDPLTATPLALEARAFVRTHHSSTRTPRLPRSPTPIRILLVISRPRRDLDVPFRSVASRLVKHLSGRDDFRLDVLRPPTFAELARVLRAAKAAGQPYHVVHFDGHGTYGTESLGPNITAQRYADHRPGQHGYLLFEQPELKQNYDLVDGPTLGNLLAETDVPVLVLNACRSAHAEPADAPAQVGDAAQPDQPDPHSEVRSFGSLAQEVIDAGVAGVVAMRYNVFVVTAAQFVAELYGALIQGSTLGEAVSRGRKHLHAEPLREVVAGRLPLQDWPVPVVYEAAPIALFQPSAAATLTISLDPSTATPTRGTLDPALPRTPDVGFFGRDETLLALDRAFDTQRVVLLHAFAGSGKTTTAAEFARWYALTGGIKDGYVIFTSFEQPLPLPRVLDTLGQRFGPLLEQNGIQWLALDDEQRRSVALQVLRQLPVLWIWDNVEPVAGFPAGTESRLSAEEQHALADFLRDLRETQAKLLLTSRRDERGWLGDLPARIAMPPMPRPERVQLARAIAAKYSRQLTEIGPWESLLQYTQGNPLTLTVVVGQALRDKLRTAKQIEAFVAKLRAGEAAFTDDVQEGRSRSLGASLSYGFAHAFSEDERRQLALLHFFQGFVDVDALRFMGDPDAECFIPEVRGLTRERGIALLDRAAEVGLLTAYGNGYYAIHPALPWYFKSLFEQYYATNEQRKQATRAFVEAMGGLGNYCHQQYHEGNRRVIDVLNYEEANLLHARQIARGNGWLEQVIDVMQGLRTLYDHTGRRVEWRRLVDEIVPDFVDLATNGPLPGREEEWSIVIQYRVWVTREARQLVEAERLQRMVVNWERQRVQGVLALRTEVLSDTQRNKARTLAASLHELGEIQRGLGQEFCIAAYQEALDLSEWIGEQSGAAICAFNMGNSYLTILSLRNLEQADYWYRYSLNLHDEHDQLGRARPLAQLGFVAYERFIEARSANQPEEELLLHLNGALQYCLQALNLMPLNAVNDLASTHNVLGNIFDDADDIDRALAHWHESISYKEAANNIYSAGETRFNIALALAERGCCDHALLYAQAALRNFEPYGAGAAADIEDTQRLIADIEAAMRGEGAAGAASD